MPLKYIPEDQRRHVFVPLNKKIAAYAQECCDQNIWSALCAAAVESAAQKIKSAEIRSLSQLTEYIMQKRALIAVILNQENHAEHFLNASPDNQDQNIDALEIGMPRRELIFTRLSASSGYIDQVSTLKSIIANLHTTPSEDELPDSIVNYHRRYGASATNTILATRYDERNFIQIESQPAETPTSVAHTVLVLAEKSTNHLTIIHSDPDNIAATLALGQTYFDECLHCDPQQEQERFLSLLGMITWHISQATPALRGGGAISMMCYQALAAAKSVCLPQEKAELTTDIRAILAPDVKKFAADFHSYFMDHAPQPVPPSNIKAHLSHLYRMLLSAQLTPSEIINLSLAEWYIFEKFYTQPSGKPYAETLVCHIEALPQSVLAAIRELPGIPDNAALIHYRTGAVLSPGQPVAEINSVFVNPAAIAKLQQLVQAFPEHLAAELSRAGKSPRA